MGRRIEISRKTKETGISLRLDLDGSGQYSISSGIPFFDHMLSLFAMHGFFDLHLEAEGDIPWRISGYALGMDLREP